MDIIQSLVLKAVKLLHWAALIFALDYDVSMKSNVMLIVYYYTAFFSAWQIYLDTVPFSDIVEMVGVVKSKLKQYINAKKAYVILQLFFVQESWGRTWDLWTLFASQW